MKKTTMEKALLATARVACCAAIVGIGCNEKIDPSDTGETTLEDCQQLVERNIDWTSILITQETKDCCQRIAESYDENLEDLNDWEQRDECCEHLNWEDSMACTPWGPPTPPTINCKKNKNKFKTV
jgi:hypothetical protein